MNKTNIFNILDFGAVSDGVTDNTAAIQKAIDAAADAGGCVVVPAAAKPFMSYTLYLRSNVEFHLDEGAVLKGGPDGTKYPEFEPTDLWDCNRAPRLDKRAFFYTLDAENVSITGNGTIDGSSEFFKVWSPARKRFWRTDDINLPGRCLFFVRCRNVRLEDFTLIHATGWNTWFLGCDNLVARGVTLDTDPEYPNGDCFHISSCRDVLVENCDISSSDDCFAIRSHQELLPQNLAVCERITVRDTVCRSSGAAFCRFGWSTDYSVRDVTFDNVDCRHCWTGISVNLPNLDPNYLEPPRGHGLPPLPSSKCRPFELQCVSFHNCRVECEEHPMQIDIGNALKPRPVKFIRNIRVKDSEFFCTKPPEFVVWTENNVSDIHFENVSFNITKTASGNIIAADHLFFDNCRNVTFENCRWNSVCGSAAVAPKLPEYCVQKKDEYPFRTDSWIGEGMVFQRDRPFVVSGDGQPGTRVNVQCAIPGNSLEGQSDVNGRACRPATAEGGSRTVATAGTEDLSNMHGSCCREQCAAAGTVPGPPDCTANSKIRKLENSNNCTLNIENCTLAEATATADANGRWSATLPPFPSGGPYVLTVESTTGEKIVLKDIYAGDIWLCSGQSNMEMPVWSSNCHFRLVDGEEVAAAAHDPMLRMLQIPNAMSEYPCERFVNDVHWLAATTAESVKPFSAAAYIFGCELRKRYPDVPIGLVHSSWGGTRIEPWIPEGALAAAGYEKEISLLAAVRRDDIELTPEQREAGPYLNWISEFMAAFKADRKTPEWRKGDRRDTPALMAPGVAEYRFFFDVKPGDESHEFVFHMDSVDDADITFVDGQEIGTTSPWHGDKFTWSKPRDYAFKVAKAGRHEIVIRGFSFRNELFIGTSIRVEDRTGGVKTELADGTWEERILFNADIQELGGAPMPPEVAYNPKSDNSLPTCLFNAMIAPLHGQKLTGVLWFQGCANGQEADRYAGFGRTLANSWRSYFGNETMPFLVAQIGAFKKESPRKRLPDDFWKDMAPDDTGFAFLREAQYEFGTEPNCGIICCMDIGDHSNIHFPNKKDVGRRFAREAFRLAYGESEFLPSPSVERAVRVGSKVIVKVKDAGRGLFIAGDGMISPRVFSLSGPDGKLYWATAEITGTDTIEVSASEVSNPVEIRYAFTGFAGGNLVFRNEDNLPLFPFRARVMDENEFAYARHPRCTLAVHGARAMDKCAMCNVQCAMPAPLVEVQSSGFRVQSNESEIGRACRPATAAGGSRVVATDTVADARERVPPALGVPGMGATTETEACNSPHGSCCREQCATAGTVPGPPNAAADAQERVPPMLPVLIWFHGGGLAAGDKAEYPVELEKDVVIVSANYRFLSDAKVEDIWDDAARAVAWTFDNIAKFGGDPNQIFVSGVSAGAYLTYMVGFNPALLARYGLKNTDIKGLISLSGQATEHYGVRSEAKDPDHIYQPKINPRAPFYYINNEIPPLMVICGDRHLDIPCRTLENEFLVASLREIGKRDVEFYEIAGTNHATSYNGFPSNALNFILMHKGGCPHVTATVDFSKDAGPIRPLHSVGQPPIPGWCGDSMFHYLTEANIPYSRLHDTGGAYGGNRFVDVPNIFRNFDADENDPASYDFAFTDKLLASMAKANLKPIYRLGVTIENEFYVTSKRIDPPKDFAKWARVCEHIIAHYNEGWANGFKYGIEYWEIWNEPEPGVAWDGLELKENQIFSMMWNGTKEQYFELYETASRHLKKRFGDTIKIGGPAATGCFGKEYSETDTSREAQIYRLVNSWNRDFLKFVADKKCPIDFYSFHSYRGMDDTVREVNEIDKILTANGLKVEKHLNEWNNVCMSTEYGRAAQGAHYAAMLIALQNETDVDIACYYDAGLGIIGSPVNYKGLFTPYCQPNVGYWPFYLFGEMYKMGTAVPVELERDSSYNGLWGVRALAAKDKDGKVAMLLANTGNSVRLSLKGLPVGVNAYAVTETRSVDQIAFDADNLLLPAHGVVYLRK